MAKKDNFGKAMFEMFGVGSEDGGEQTAPEAKAPAAGFEVEETEPEESVITAVKEPLYTEPAEPFVSQEPVQPRTFRTPQPASDYNFRPAMPSKNAEATFIAEGTIFEGTISSRGDIEIAGEFRGNINADGRVNVMNTLTGNITAGSIDVSDCTITGDLTADGNITVSEQTEITGNITCRNIDCAGRIAGDLEIAEMMSLASSAWINGNIRLGSMQVERGAKITGKIDMQ